MSSHKLPGPNQKENLSQLKDIQDIKTARAGSQSGTVLRDRRPQLKFLSSNLLKPPGGWSLRIRDRFTEVHRGVTSGQDLESGTGI